MFSQRADHYDRNEILQKRVKSPNKGKRAYPHKARRQNHTSQQGQQCRICERHRVPATAAGQNPRDTHKSQRGRQDRLSERRRARHLQRQRSRPPQKPTRPPANDGGANLTMEGYKIKWVRKTRGRNTDTVRKTKKVRRNFSADPSKKMNRYASEGSHSTMQLFKNGLESGASALTIRNLASPSAVLQTSVRKRTPGRTGEAKRHLKRVIASG